MKLNAITFYSLLFAMIFMLACESGQKTDDAQGDAVKQQTRASAPHQGSKHRTNQSKAEEQAMAIYRQQLAAAEAAGSTDLDKQLKALSEAQALVHVPGQENSGQGFDVEAIKEQFNAKMREVNAKRNGGTTQQPTPAPADEQIPTPSDEQPKTNETSGPTQPTGTAIGQASRHDEQMAGQSANRIMLNNVRMRGQYLVAQRLAMPRNDRALFMRLQSLPAPKSFDEEVLKQWHRNDLYISSVPMSQLPLFIANLPRLTNRKQTVLPVIAKYEPIVTIDHVTQAQVINYKNPQDDVQQLVTHRGQHRIMLRYLASLHGNKLTPMVELLPHHFGLTRGAFGPKPTTGRELRGLAFYDLRVEMPMPKDEAWIIWTNPAPEVEVKDLKESIVTGGKTFKTIGEQGRSLGKTFLHAKHGSKHVQVMLLIFPKSLK